MARWLLTHAHYLNCVGKDSAEWEYKERDRKTQRMKKFTFPVPAFLDPNDDTQWTFKDGIDAGGIIVSWDNDSALPSDILFEGSPTPDMRPMDDEAKRITAEMAAVWDAKPEDLQDSYGDHLTDRFVQELSRIRSEAAPAGVKLEGMGELLAAITEMMKQNQALIAALAPPAAGVARRV